MNERIAAGSPYVDVGSETRNVSRPSALEADRHARQSARSSEAAGRRRPAASATAPPRRPRARCAGPGATPWRRGRRSSARRTGDCRAASDAGHQAEDDPAAIDTRERERRARGRRRRSRIRAADRAAPTPRDRRSRTRAARRRRRRSATAAGSRLHIQRVRSQRLAPSAARTAASCDRAVARTSSRFATLAQATSSTRPTAPISTSSGEPRAADRPLANRHEPQAGVRIGVGVGRVGARVAARDRVDLGSAPARRARPARAARPPSGSRGRRRSGCAESR